MRVMQGEPQDDTQEEQRHILLAEDDEAIRTMYAAVWEAQGFRVTAVSDGLAALQAALAEEKPPDFILLDYDMPILNGLEVMQRLKNIERTKEVWMCILSNHDQRTLQDWLKKMEPLTWIIKARMAPSTLGRQLRDVAQRQRPKQVNEEQREG